MTRSVFSARIRTTGACGDLAERLLATTARRVAALEAAGADLAPFDAPEVAGIAGTTIGTDFSFELVRWLSRRYPRRVRLAWDAGASEERMRSTWPEFLPLLEEEALADANVPYLDWLAAVAGRRRDEPAWLLERYERLSGSARRSPPIDSTPSRSRSPGTSATARRPGRGCACRGPRRSFTTRHFSRGGTSRSTP